MADLLLQIFASASPMEADQILQKLISVSSREEVTEFLRQAGLSRDEARAKVHKLYTDGGREEEEAPEQAAPSDGPQTMIAKAFRAERQREEIRQAYIADLAQTPAENEAIEQKKFHFQCADMRAVFQDKKKWHEPRAVADPDAVAELKKDFSASFNAALDGHKDADSLEAALIAFRWKGWTLTADVVDDYLKTFGPSTKILEASNGT